MSLLLAWVVFPAVLAVVSLGLGLLAQSAAGTRIAGALLLPCGFAALVVVSQLATMTSLTAPLAVPAVLVLAAAGLVLGVRARPRLAAIDDWPAIASLGVFAVFAAPVVLSGSATFTGWIKLDDGSTWLAFADRLVEHGRNVSGLAHSTYELTLALNFGNGYPLGAFAPLGVGGKLVRQDVAWLLQPFMAFAAAMLALALYALVAGVVRTPALRALAAFVGAQAALYFGYALWGGVKEIVAAPLIATSAALLEPVVARGSSARAAVPLAITVAAVLGVESGGGAVWLLPVLGAAVVLLVRERGWTPTLRAGGVFAAVALLLAIPTLATTLRFAHELSSSSVGTGGDVLGNLLRPLRFAQVLGVWPTGDFRVAPHDFAPTTVLLVVVAAAAVAGVVLAVRRRAEGFLVYVAGAVLGAVALDLAGSPWIGAKALATAAPAFVVAAVAGACWLLEGGRRVEGTVVAIAICGGVLWSNVLQYHDVWLAPRAQLRELESVGHRYDGDGPTLMTEFNPYGVRHFLRHMDAEAAGEYRWRVVPLLDGSQLRKGAYADIDQFQTQGILDYRTLVLRRSATASRPPSVYRLVWQGRFYEVWQRDADAGSRVVLHVPLGSGLDPTAAMPCAKVLSLARTAAPGTRIAAVERPADTTVALDQASRPATWRADPLAAGAVVPAGKGQIAAIVDVARPGRYGLWLGGSFRDSLQLLVDAKVVWTGRHQLNWPGLFTPVGETDLTAGKHLVLLRYSGPRLRPGDGGAPFGFGPLVLGTTTAASDVTYVEPANARALCGKRLDWLEIVR